MKTVGVVAHPRRNCSEVFAAVVGWAHERDVQLLTLPEVRGELLPSVERVQPEELVASADLVLAAGGDGTILRALSIAAPARIPVLGVNLGRLAFLAEVDPGDIADALTQIELGSYEIEERLALDCRWRDDGRDVCVRAFNDVVLLRSPGHGEAALAVSVGGQLFARFAADGVIAATPTGSTAYNLSAGGPVVYPTLETILLTPVSAHTLALRPLVLPATAEVTLHANAGPDELLVTVDGQVGRTFGHGDALIVRRSQHPLSIVRFPEQSFFATMREKLHWGGLLDRDEPTRC